VAYTYRNGDGSPSSRSFSLGPGSCGATINFEILSTRQ
jgi:hypothetical protein